MLFFTRSLFCVGAIMVLAEGLGPDRILTKSSEALEATTRAATDRIAALCRQEPARCLALAGSVAGVALPALGPSKVSEPQPMHARTAKAAARRRPGRTGVSAD